MDLTNMVRNQGQREKQRVRERGSSLTGALVLI
jgi:hypothetical protein